jgi:hypothetical protein
VPEFLSNRFEISSKFRECVHLAPWQHLPQCPGKCPKRARSRAHQVPLTPSAAGKMSDRSPTLNSRKSPKVGRKARISAQNSISDIGCDIAHRSDRPLGHIGALNHGKWIQRSASWADEGALVTTSFVNSAPTASNSRARDAARGSGHNGRGQNAKVDNH